MNPILIYNLAKSIQPFFKDGIVTREVIYQKILKDKHLDFIRQVIPLRQIPLLVFVAYSLHEEKLGLNDISEIYSNMFCFGVIEFGDSTNDIECDQCGGEGSFDCHKCDNVGQIPCDTCDSNGQVENSEGDIETCDDCGGDGENECDYCYGSGREDCEECGGAGTVTIYDSIPYEKSCYISINSKLHEVIQQKILRMEPITDNEFLEDSILISNEDVQASKEDTDSIDNKYENESYFNEVLSYDECTVVSWHHRLEISEISNMDAERFY